MNFFRQLPKELDEAKGIITADYQNYLEKEWISKLKGKYEVVVNDEILTKLIESQSSTE